MRTMLIICAAIVVVPRLFSQEIDIDSSRVYPLGEVVVTATRSPVSLDDSPSHVSLLTSETLLNANGSTLGDLLSDASGFFLRENGGGGSISTISVRGGASEHVLLLLNGMRYNSFQNGLADLNLLPLQNIQRVEAVSGGSSALYGADALSGVINILTKKASGDSHIGAQAGIGSFGRNLFQLEGESAIGPFNVLAGYGMERGRDDYPFKDAGSPTSREDADFIRRQLFVQGSANLDVHTNFNLMAQDVSADRGSPGAYNPLIPADARLSDNDVAVNADISHGGSSGVSWKLASGLHYMFETYRDPDPLYPYETFYKNFSFTLNPQLGWQVSAGQQLMAGGEFSQGSLDSPDFDGRVLRVQKAIYLSYLTQFSFEGNVFNRISTYATIRFDNLSDVENAFTPKFGLNVRLCSDGNVRLRSSIGKNFRSPSFNDLYFRYFGNPLLKPEHSTSFDAGVSGEVHAIGTHSLEAAYFIMNTEDRILFDPIAFIPVNIGKVKSSGVELHYALSMFGGSVNAGVNYSLTDARKLNADSSGDPSYDRQLIYIPKDILNLSLSAGVGIWTVNVHHTFTGERFITADNSRSLPAYRLTDVNLICKPVAASIRWMVKGEIANLFDREHVVFSGYPMPGRSYRVTVGLEY